MRTRSSIRTVVPLAFLAWTVLAGCKEVKVENGEIPAKYLAMAQQYAGTYRGEMRKIPGVLTLSVRGNKAVVEFQNEHGRDILDPKCESQIGNLLSVTVNDEGGGRYSLSSAKFAFNSNRCHPSVRGRELVLDFIPKDSRMRLKASILRETHWERRCRVEPGNPRAGVPPREVCDPVAVPDYFDGRFIR